MPITSSAVDLLRQLGELADLFAELAISGGLGVTQTWPVLRVPAERFVELLDAQLCAYCMALRREWRRGEDGLPFSSIDEEYDEAQAAVATADGNEEGTRGDGNGAGGGVGESGLVLRSGRLEKMPSWLAPRDAERDWDVHTSVGWANRLFALYPNKLVWTREEPSPPPAEGYTGGGGGGRRGSRGGGGERSQRREMRLDARTTVQLHSSGGALLTLRITNAERTLLLRAPLEASAKASLLLRRSSSLATHSPSSTASKPRAADPLAASPSIMASGSVLRGWAQACEAVCAAQGGVATLRLEGGVGSRVLLRRGPTHDEDAAARRVQQLVRAQRARRVRSDGHEAGSAMPHSVHGLCLMLNNVSWGKARLDEIARRLRRRLPGLLAIPRAELRCSLEACDETCAEMCVYLVRRIVYRGLLAHLLHANEGSLGGLLTKLNQAAAAAAATARPPWRLPLLLLLLGTFATALDAKLSSPTRFARLVRTRTAVLLPRHEIGLLRESFAGEATELNAAVSAALEEDLSAEAAGGQIYLASVERCASAHEHRPPLG